MTAASDFKLLEAHVDRHHIGNRTRSAALLGWFLTDVWRSDPDRVEDAICDGGGDRGIDGILVDEDTKDIVVLQAKHRRKATTTQGERDLRDFLGVAPYFSGPEGIDNLLASKPNQELEGLVRRLDLRDKLESGSYTVSLVFVTNAVADATATDYLSTIAESVPTIDLWDRSRLVGIAHRVARPSLVDLEVVLTPSSGVLEQDLGGARLVAALVPATELVRLPGIADLTIFDLNVRLGLGRTRINKELSTTIEDAAEHQLFPAYHNGLTLLSNAISVTDEGIALQGLSVVNGCQSLLALYGSRSRVTPGLFLMVKIVQLDDDMALADKITYRSNNQNPVNMRDQRANDAAQRDLQRQVEERFGGAFFYSVRNGDAPKRHPAVLDNQLAAQLITAVWLREPWAAVRKVKLFDDEYYRVFHRSIDADKLFLAYHLDQVIGEFRSDLRPRLQSAFASVRFTLAYLVAQVVRLGKRGESLFEDPGPWLPKKVPELRAVLSDFVDHVVASVNEYVDDREEDVDFDPKIAFKSRDGVRAVEREVVQIARVLHRRTKDFAFSVKP